MAAVLRIVYERALVVAPAGGMTQMQAGGIPHRVDVLLQTTRLDDIKHYDPGDLTIGVGAGIRLGKMQRAFGEHQQWISLDPPHIDFATIRGPLGNAPARP